MRDLKFRVWNATAKMVEPHMVYLDPRKRFDGDDLVSEEGWTVMQYTGLKDKNGTPIFEGDILATSNDGTNGADVWSNEDFGYAVVREDTDNLFDGVQCKNWFPNTYSDDSVFSIKYVEVIGNIYENPDLLA